MRHTSVRLPALVALLAALLAACESHDPASRNDSIVAQGDSDYVRSHRATMPPETTGVAAKAAPPAALNDSSISAIAAAADQLALEMARMAVGRASSGELKYFARQIIDDHGRNQRDLRDLEKRIGVVERLPAQDTTLQALDHLKQRFGALRGTAFDTAFVRYVADRSAHDIAVTKNLAAKAKHAELKKQLAETLSDLQRHVDKARLIGKAMGQRKS